MNNRTFTHISIFLSLTITKIADFLLPKEKDVKILESFGPDGLFDNIPRSENFDFETDKIKAIFNYKTPLCRQAIWEVKYRANKKLIRDFSLLLYEYILEELTDLETFNNFKNIILLPVPSSPKRTREKGFNQCILICQELIKIDEKINQPHIRHGVYGVLEKNFSLEKNILIKIKETEHQVNIQDRRNRLKNLSDSFFVKNEDLIKGKNIILIDDVLTTGATLNEAKKILKNSGARKIIAFTIAH